MQSVDEIVHDGNVQICLGLGWTHMLSRADLESELRRLEERQEQLRRYFEACTERTNLLIARVRECLDAEK